MSKENETVRVDSETWAAFETWKATLPKCPESCDGYLVGEDHDADCPVGLAGGFATMYDAFAAGWKARRI